MKLHLVNNAFVPHAGDESVVWCPRTGGCTVLRNAQPILEEVTREWRDMEDIVRAVCEKFECGVDEVCGAYVNSLCLSANGDYYPCPGFAGVPLGNCYKDTLHHVWLESEATKRIRAVTGNDFGMCADCKDRDYCSTCMCRNFNETGDMFKPAEHFCKVASINHEVVDEKQHQMIEAVKRGIA